LDTTILVLGPLLFIMHSNDIAENLISLS